MANALTNQSDMGPYDSITATNGFIDNLEVVNIAPLNGRDHVSIDGNVFISEGKSLVGSVTGNVTGNVIGNITGNLTGNVLGNITGNVTGNITGTATNFSGVLDGDIVGTQNNTQIASGVITNLDISSSAGITDEKLAIITSAGKVANSATTRTSENDPDTLVMRDDDGNFSARDIMATRFHGDLTGDVTVAGGLNCGRGGCGGGGDAPPMLRPAMAVVGEVDARRAAQATDASPPFS